MLLYYFDVLVYENVLMGLCFVLGLQLNFYVCVLYTLSPFIDERMPKLPTVGVSRAKTPIHAILL